MLRIKKFGANNKFKDNKQLCVNKHGVTKKRQVQRENGNASASKKKVEVRSSHSLNSNICSDTNIIIISVNLLYDLVKKNTACINCGGEVSLFENKKKRKGIVSNLVIQCMKCDCTASTMTSHITRSRLYDNSIHLVYGLRSIGKGRCAGEMICSMLNIPQPPTKFSIYNKTLLSDVAEVSEGSMLNAVREAMQHNDADDSKNIAAAFDGSWQKCGHT